MALQIVAAKVQTACLTRKEKSASTRGPDEGKAIEKVRRFRVTIGTYIEFNDGGSIVGPDGRIHHGRGTVVRFNYRHGTWSVQRPQRCETNRMGYVFTLQGNPCWLKDQRESGFTLLEFMLKPDDPVWAELMADIKAVVSSRSEDGFAFTSLHRTEQWDFFTTSGFYSPYMDRVMTYTQITRIIHNAINGQPQEKWLEGVFDPGHDTPTIADIRKAVGREPEKPRMQERGGREM